MACLREGNGGAHPGEKEDRDHTNMGCLSAPWEAMLARQRLAVREDRGRQCEQHKSERQDDEDN